MGLFQRISDIIAANLNEMTDSFEDPEKMLRQAIREMESSIAEATLETAKVLANQKLLDRELAGNQRQMADWHAKADLAVQAGDDELARKALLRKREHQKLVVALQDQLTSAAEASKVLRHQLEGMQAKLAEARRSLATLSARKRAADFRKKMHTSPGMLDTPIDADNAFAKFDRLRARVEQAEAEADALAELRGAAGADDADSDASFASEAKDDVDAELALLKTRKNG